MNVNRHTYGTSGTCPICLQNMMVDEAGLLVAHGYKRPGYGFLVGMCFGRGFRPYEKGTEALVKYRPMVESHLLARQTYRMSLETVAVLPHPDSSKRFPKPDVTRSDVFNWNIAMRIAVSRADREVLWAEEELARVCDLIERWVEAPYRKKQKAIEPLSNSIEVGARMLAYGREVEVLAKGVARNRFSTRRTFSGIRVRRIEDGQEYVVEARTLKPLVTISE